MNTKKTQTHNSVCAVCGYRHLASAQRTTTGGASHEICPSCGFESGYSDDVQGITFEQWRATWVSQGLQWFSKGTSKPKDWNPMRDIHSLMRRKRPVISARILAQVEAARNAPAGEVPVVAEPPAEKAAKAPTAKKRKAS